MLRYILSCGFVFFVGYCGAQVEFYSDPETVTQINSPSGENFIYLNRDEESMYFTRERHPQNSKGTADTGDLWRSDFDSAWSFPVKLPINDGAFASPLGMTPDGKYFMFNKVWYDKGLYHGGVFAFNPDRPLEEMEIKVPYFKNRSPLQTGSLSADGRYLLLSLENSAGYGVDDLFVCFLQPDGSWSYPKNLGHIVNTRFQEITPFVAADNKTLFFASNGREGAGSFDLYMAVRLDDTWQRWSQPVNLGNRVNTPGAESSLVFRQGSEYAYFVSTQNSDGYGDVKRVRIRSEIEAVAVEEPAVALHMPDTTVAVDRVVRSVSLVFKNAESGDPVPCTVTAGVVQENGRLIKSDSSAGPVLSYGVNIGRGEVCKLRFRATGFLSEEVSLGWEDLSDTMSILTIGLEPLESGNTITLRNVLFYRGTANFVEGSERELNLVVEMLRENPDISIFLKGHTDNVGNPIMNVQLSQERVQAVKDYVVRNGVSAGRVTGKGYGGSEPVASNDEEETRKLNRRVEFEIRRED